MRTHGYRLPSSFPVHTLNTTADERRDAHANCQQLLPGPGETVPIVGGTIHVGTSQGIFFTELDHPRSREALEQIVGE